jgi:hypothetical protein
LDIYRGKSEKFTDDGPMKYGTCRDFVAPLQSGDQIEFKVGDASAGTFAVAELPQNDAVLFLVISRHDTLSTAVSFESHVFANLKNAEIVVVDAYRGAKQSTVVIKDAPKGSFEEASTTMARSEELRYDSVVAIDPGDYEVELVGSDSKRQAKTRFKAVERETYVILRTGLEAQDGQSYPQELLIYPNSLQSIAVTTRASIALLGLVVGLAHLI